MTRQQASEVVVNSETDIDSGTFTIYVVDKPSIRVSSKHPQHAMTEMYELLLTLEPEDVQKV